MENQSQSQSPEAPQLPETSSVTSATTQLADLPPNELQMRLAHLRQKAAQGELTLEEGKEIVLFLRQGRLAANAALAAKPKRATKAKAPAPNSDDLLAELGGL